MEQIRFGLTVIGGLILVVGLLWVGHGTGAISLPGTGFISKESVWVINGALVAAFGLLVLVATRRLLRKDGTHIH
ncbi:hypothetical protein [Ciceribacter sp. L1K22]|uniref:hypothetical protein n=1 Tax=Ciceribacter sp. L1K22 TaxID=2820275 RepID=UPI001ABDC6D4|nr:hypothetical protein [Ciceribacter sp. L1K22]MBO3759531.1 hypothetical protein [Ciceribacter sp. L1K22]